MNQVRLSFQRCRRLTPVESEFEATDLALWPFSHHGTAYVFNRNARHSVGYRKRLDLLLMVHDASMSRYTRR